MSLIQLLCRHLEWQPVAPVVVEDDHNLHVTWAAIECVRCRKVRLESFLKPKEAFVIDMSVFGEDFTH